jgi:hypothetical protein
MAITANTKILTLDYWKHASHLQEGDYVFDAKGRLVKVTLVQEYHSAHCYEVTFNDHLSVTGDSKLTFPTENFKYRNRLVTYKGKLKFRRPLRPLTAEELLETPLVSKHKRKTTSVPTANPLSLPHKDLPIPPFLFGFWFFSRKSTGKMVPARGTRELVHEKFKDHGYKVRVSAITRTGEREFSVTPRIESQLIPNIPKVITNNYLLASEEQRTELLRGIICAKNRQYCARTDTFRFSSKNYDTVRRVQALAESLGCKTSMHSDSNKEDYTVKFKSRINLHPEQASPPLKVHYGRRYITNITPIPAQLCVHIETNGKDGTILAGEGFIPCL